MRDAQTQALQAGQTAGVQAGQYGANAAAVNANLAPYLTRQLNNPAGMSQRDIGAQLTNALAGAGGTTSALSGAATRMGGMTRNPVGFAGALDSAARSRDKAAASTAEGVEANNADVKLKQQSQAAQGLGSLYGMDTHAQMGESEQQAGDINSAVGADKTGWFQRMQAILSDVAGKPQGGS